MKVEVYGQPYNQSCQNAVGLLKSANIKVKFHNTDKDYTRSKLIAVTRDLQKESGYTFKCLDDSPIPIVISPDTEEVLVGYSQNSRMYDNILKKAGVEEVDNFINKYPEWRRKSHQEK